MTASRPEKKSARAARASLWVLVVAGAIACGAAPDGAPVADEARAAELLLEQRLPIAFRDPDPEYAARDSGEGWRFLRPGLVATIGARPDAALELRAGDLELALAVIEIARGAEHVTLGGARVEVDGARTRVLRGESVTELFAHGAPGIEHAIAVRRAPPGDGPLEIVVALAGAAQVEVDERAARVRGARGREALSYEGLRAWDAAGRELAAHMQPDARGVRLVVDDRGAVLPIVIDPLIALRRAVLVASDAAEDDELGASVDYEGGLAVVGAPERAGGGAAYVFERTPTGWVERATLVPPMASPGDDAGTSVALSGDTIVIGSPDDNHPVYSGAGAVDVFRRVGAGWTHEARIANPEPTISNERFGHSVAIAGDVMVVGAIRDRTAGTSGAGGAYVYRRTGTTWAPEGPLLWSRLSSNDEFGASVATDGTRMAVGAPGENGMILDGDGFVVNLDVGAVFVFARGTGDAWVEEARLAAATERSFEYVGTSVAIDGTRVISGATGADDDEGTIDRRGAAYVFTRSGAAWSQEARLVPQPVTDWAIFASFGTSVALQGARATVGAPGARSTGVAYAFERDASGWSQATSIAGDVTTAQLGAAMGLDGATWVVGAPWENAQRGAAHVLELTMTGALGQPCTAPADCDSGFCADGVCCDVACAGGPTDCLACSVAGGAVSDGTCGPVAASTVCRAAVGGCDAAEACDGVSVECPEDVREPAGVACRAAVGPCDREETCSGTAITCPFDAQREEGEACDDGLACNGADACTAGACVPADAALDCDDGDACTADACDDAGGCSNERIAGCCATDVDCDDGDACTADACAAARCEHAPIASCGDDAGAGDAGPAADAGANDAGTTSIDAGAAPSAAGGCGCAVPGPSPGAPIAALGMLAALALPFARARRRRRCRS